MPRPPAYIDFEGYTENVPPGIPAAVQRATDRFAVERLQRVAELPQWEELRQAASDIRLHTIENLDHYLLQAEAALQSAGVTVHWAATAEDARRVVTQIARDHQVKLAIKAKSMATEEIDLNSSLESVGIEARETDLGEFIVQLSGTGPTHILVPAVHLTREEVAELFHDKLHIDAPADPTELTHIARRVLRERFLQADLGITGANFLIAETGTIVLVTNEGNGRMTATLPDVHVAVVGIDKIVPDWETLTVLLKLLARSATGQKISAYTQFITGPRREDGEFGPGELHVVLLDNGRSKILQDPIGREVFKCIRCGACANVCPVYNNTGGFAYGWFISGPIGSIFSPQILGTRVARELPFASTLCGACADVCPVKIPIPAILRHLRRRVSQGDDYAQPTLNAGMRTLGSFISLSFAHPSIYRLGTRLLPLLNIFSRGKNWLSNLPFPLSRWTRIRPLPEFEGNFRQWWKKREIGGKGKEPR